jgi:hypothetical protein
MWVDLEDMLNEVSQTQKERGEKRKKSVKYADI